MYLSGDEWADDYSTSGEGAEVFDPADDTFGPPYVGVCGGCPSGEPQTVRDVSGGWGAATVCRYHEDHA